MAYVADARHAAELVLEIERRVVAEEQAVVLVAFALQREGENDVRRLLLRGDALAANLLHEQEGETNGTAAPDQRPHDPEPENDDA